MMGGLFADHVRCGNCLALIVNQTVFRSSYELFDGNRADVSTVERFCHVNGNMEINAVLDSLIVVVLTQRTWWHPQARGQYLVGTARSKLKQFEQELLKDDSKRSVRSGGQADHHSRRQETYILCRTADGRKKKAIRSRFVAKIEKALAGLKAHRGSKLKDRDKMLALGPHPASHPQWRIYMRCREDSKEGPRLIWRRSRNNSNG